MNISVIRPPSIRDPTLTLTLFCSRLKTHLFGFAYRRALVTAEAVRAARYKCSHTYIHTYKEDFRID